MYNNKNGKTIKFVQQIIKYLLKCQTVLNHLHTNVLTFNKQNIIACLVNYTTV